MLISIATIQKSTRDCINKVAESLLPWLLLTSYQPPEHNKYCFSWYRIGWIRFSEIVCLHSWILVTGGYDTRFCGCIVELLTKPTILLYDEDQLIDLVDCSCKCPSCWSMSRIVEATLTCCYPREELTEVIIHESAVTSSLQPSLIQELALMISWCPGSLSLTSSLTWWLPPALNYIVNYQECNPPPVPD